MGKADEADAAEVRRLQQELQRLHADLDGLDRDAPGRAEQLLTVFAATERLLDFEDQVPRRRETRLRRISSAIVYVAGAAAAVAMLVSALLMATGRASLWYLIPAVPTVLFAGGLTAAEHRAPVQGHRLRAAAVVVVAATAGLIVTVIAGLLTSWALAGVLVGLIAAGGLWASTPDHDEAGVTR
ncbi:hypothetical protein [Actinoplanes xinjiangensis]|uniref:hypothetical protein n=1 Tax=Actinoplanes xinjiangensis TaxID=512350 RepID=UPI0034136A5F